MSLRRYLFLATGACLLISLSFGAVLIFWSANRSVETELTAATASTADTLQRYLKNRSDFSISRVDSIVAGFDGQRHVRVTLLSASSKPVTSSRLAMPQEPAPRWFARLIGAAPIV